MDGENVQIYKNMKVTMDKYIFCSYFYALDMDEVDVILGYPWMDSIGTINISVQKKLLNLCYKKKYLQGN